MSETKDQLHIKYRPRKLSQIIGQPNTVNKLEKKVAKNNIPHSILITGPAGCGKTTLARIIKRLLKCSKFDFIEDAPRKVDDVRAIGSSISQAPMKGNCRIWLIDECHKLTSDAQDEFLKMLEDTPNHIYFLLTTTDPQKLKPTVKQRCMPLEVKSLSESDLEKLITYVLKKEKKKLHKDVIEKIIENCEGSARKSLVILDSVIDLDSKKEQLASIVTPDAEQAAFDIVREILYKGQRSNWKKISSVIKNVNTENPETIRHLVLACATTEILKAGKFSAQAYLVIEAFRDNFFDSKLAGLCAACYECITAEK